MQDADADRSMHNLYLTISKDYVCKTTCWPSCVLFICADVDFLMQQRLVVVLVLTTTTLILLLLSSHSKFAYGYWSQLDSFFTRLLEISNVLFEAESTANQQNWKLWIFFSVGGVARYCFEDLPRISQLTLCRLPVAGYCLFE